MVETGFKPQMDPVKSQPSKLPEFIIPILQSSLIEKTNFLKVENYTIWFDFSSFIWIPSFTGMTNVSGNFKHNWYI